MNEEQLKLSLFTVISQWCKLYDDELGIYWADETIQRIVDAAWNVLAAIADCENCAEREGWFDPVVPSKRARSKAKT